jgi:hypothetical protein
MSTIILHGVNNPEDRRGLMRSFYFRVYTTSTENYWDEYVEGSHKIENSLTTPKSLKKGIIIINIRAVIAQSV